MKERYERELDSLRNNSSKSEKDRLAQHLEELERMRGQLLSQLATEKMQAEELLEQTKQVNIYY